TDLDAGAIVLEAHVVDRDADVAGRIRDPQTGGARLNPAVLDEKLARGGALEVDVDLPHLTVTANDHVLEIQRTTAREQDAVVAALGCDDEPAQEYAGRRPRRDRDGALPGQRGNPREDSRRP